MEFIVTILPATVVHCVCPVRFSGDYVSHAHFGGGIFSKKETKGDEKEDGPKTKKEIIEEIIAKSKKAKVRHVVVSVEE